MFGFLFRKNSKRPIVTFTGESVQPVRLHYAVLNPSKVLSNLHSLNCMEQTIVNQRFQWFFAHEVKNGPATFEPRQQPKSITAIGFVFFSKDGKKLIVRVLSHDRALFAIKFFDHYFSRKHLRLEYMDVYNRIFNASLENLRMVKDTDLLFPEAKQRRETPKHCRGYWSNGPPKIWGHKKRLMQFLRICLKWISSQCQKLSASRYISIKLA